MNSPPPHVTARCWSLALCAGICGVYELFFLGFAHRVGPADQDQFLVFHELQYWNSALFGLAKQWTPVMCSGLSLAGEPQVPFMSLSMMMGYVLGPFWGLKVATVLYFIAGAAGGYLYSGLWLQGRLQRALAASLFIGNGFFVCRLGYGHVDFVPFLVLPLVLWTLHRVRHWSAQAQDVSGLIRLLGTVALLGAVFSLAIDGSPVAIIHLVVWIALYTLVLSITIRSWIPLAVLACSLAVTCLLDAGYLWPMLRAEEHFPRRTLNSFTSILSLLWFALLPVRGKLLPANGNGHELSVFIGPVIAYAIWRYRDWLRRTLPDEMKQPLLVVSIVSIVLGMGSLEPLHVPRWLSPFDLLRPLPGFRSLGVTGRYWGFLALPLSLLGAAALWRMASEARSAKQAGTWMGAALVLQLGFQSETILVKWLGTDYYHSVPWKGHFNGRPEPVQYIAMHDRALQGEFIAPARGVINCYDMDDFIRADMSPGRQLVRRAIADWNWRGPAIAATGGFTAWNQMRLQARALDWPATLPPPQRMQLVLNQAYHPDWNVPGCQVVRGRLGNLILDCPAPLLLSGPVTVTFFDQLSARASAVSVAAWRLWLCFVAALVAAAMFILVRNRIGGSLLPERTERPCTPHDQRAEPS